MYSDQGLLNETKVVRVGLLREAAVGEASRSPAADGPHAAGAGTRRQGVLVPRHPHPSQTT
jgi:hypothetical protein